MKKYIQNRNQISFDNQTLKAGRIQSGFSLIEIMVAAVILSIGILGVVSLQIIGLKGTHQSYMKQQAVSVVQSLTERMHSNKQGIIDGNYHNIDSSTFDCSVLPNCTGSSSNCSVAEIATVDLHNIICGYKKGSSPSTGGIVRSAVGDISPLVEGALNVNCVAGDCSAGDIQINVQWREREIGSEIAGPKDSLLVTTRIIR